MPTKSDYLNAINANAAMGSTGALPAGYSLIYSSWGDQKNSGNYTPRAVTTTVHKPVHCRPTFANIPIPLLTTGVML